MRFPVVLAVLTSTALAPVRAQSPQGVWKAVEVVIAGGENPAHHTTDVQPSLLIITNKHYAMLLVQGFAARPDFSATPTDEERANVWGPFTANAGTYTLKDSTLSFTPSVAKNPAVMSGTTNTFKTRIRADSMWTTTTNAGVETRTKWVRVERPPAH